MLNQYHILVVDDNAAIVPIIETLLKQAGSQGDPVGALFEKNLS